MSSCCKCAGHTGTDHKGSPAMFCLVPRADSPPSGHGATKPSRTSTGGHDDFHLLDEDYIKKHFKLPPRPLYLEPFRRPLITFPIGGEIQHFNMARKTKTNQQILDGILDASEAISAPSVFPYAKSHSESPKAAEEDEETIYILQLPDLESHCPEHNKTVRIPRYIWHSCKTAKKGKAPGELKQGGGPLNKPKPWLLSRLTDFDLLSQW